MSARNALAKPGSVGMKYWLHSNGSIKRSESCAGEGSWCSPQPIVAIPLEDREEVERLALFYMRTWTTSDPIDPGSLKICADQMQAALREFADQTPPRPEEPTGLGAVVEDAEGERWVRSNPHGANEWEPESSAARGLGPFRYRNWDRIPAVRVLSEGWSE